MTNYISGSLSNIIKPKNYKMSFKNSIDIYLDIIRTMGYIIWYYTMGVMGYNTTVQKK